MNNIEKSREERIKGLKECIQVLNIFHRNRWMGFNAEEIAAITELSIERIKEIIEMGLKARLLIYLGEGFYQMGDEHEMEAYISMLTRAIQMILLPKGSRILLEGTDSLRIHPALDFTEHTCFIGIFLPYYEEERDREIEQLCILTDKGELFPATPQDLKERRIILKHKPVRFEPRISLKAIRSFLSRDQDALEPADLFEEVKNCFKWYIEFPQDADYDLFSLWTIGTYLHPLFRSYPYIYLGGMKESGKTKTLSVLNCLAFNPIFSGNISTSSLFRLIQNARCTLLIDETERLANPQRAEDFRSILLSGYKQGAKVYRAERDSRDRFEPLEFETYSPKAIANIRGLEGVLESRCISFVMKRTKSKEIGNREPDPHDPLWQDVRDHLYLFALKHWRNIKEDYEALKNTTQLSNREWELWHPILALANFIGIYKSMIELAEQKANERRIENMTETGEYVLVEVLSEFVQEDDFYKIKDIKEKMESKFDELQGWLTNEWVGRALKRLGFSEKRRIGTGIEYKLSRNAVEDLAARLGIAPSQPQQPTQHDVKEV
jgi:uncharacterized protein YkuJ